ncbi:MAG TPA: GntR family transcriptional regulator, partial [Desulfuromonadales bacterium]|nr:GntR family transcriptional regulator [Desulfuromonadales bacterium]
TAGSRLPTEHDLSRRYGVNRHTAREALRQLKDDGLVYSVRGKGTFVAHGKVLYRVSRKVRFTAAILEAGLTPGAVLLDAYQGPSDPELAARLGIEAGDRVVTLEILRSVNAIPFSLTVSTLPAGRFGDLPEFLGEGFSLYELLRERYGVEASRQSSVFEVALPEDRDVELLQIPRSIPLLVARSLATDAEGQPVEDCVSRMRGDLGSVAVDFD